MPKLAIVDQNAVCSQGHYLLYTRRLAEEATHLFDKVEVWCNSKCDFSFPPSIPAIKAFQTDWTDVQFNNKTSDLPETIYSLIERQSFTRQDIIFIHSIGVNELHTLLTFCNNSLYSGPRFILLLRYDPALSDHDFSQTFEAVRALQGKTFPISFISDTLELSNSYEEKLGVPVTAVPVAVSVQPTIVKQSTDALSEPLCFCFMGDARSEKNYHRLPEAIKLLERSHVNTGNIRFKLQSNFNSSHGDKGYQQIRDRLKTYPSDQVELIYGPYDEDEYLRQMASADVILIPYHTNQYANRSSGILVEAMALGKPVIVPAGTWMAGQVSADHAVIIDSIEGLANGIAFAYKSIQKLREGAQKKRVSILQNNSFKALSKSIFRNVI